MQNVINNEKIVFTIKRLLKMLSIICLMLVFSPMFLVSCNSQTVEVSIMTALEGVTMYGETVVEPQPLMFLCLIIPVVIFVVLYLSKYSEKNKAKFIALCSLINVIILVTFRNGVARIAKENNCFYETTLWYFINFGFVLSILSISILILINKISLETNLFNKVYKKDVQDSIVGGVEKIAQATNELKNKISETLDQSRDGCCPKCGKKIKDGCSFCIYCGEPLLIQKEEELTNGECSENPPLEPGKAGENSDDKYHSNNLDDNDLPVVKSNYCQNCGSKLEDDSDFCTNCGAKV